MKLKPKLPFPIDPDPDRLLPPLLFPDKEAERAAKEDGPDKLLLVLLFSHFFMFAFGLWVGYTLT